MDYFFLITITKIQAQIQRETSPVLTQQIDSLKNLIYVSEQSIPRIELLLSLSRLQLSSFPEESYQNSSEALQLSRQKNYTLGIARSKQYIGLFFFNQSNYVQAIEHYLESINLYQEIPSWQGLAETYNQIGQTYQYSTQIEQAFKSYQKALKIFQEQNDLAGQGETFGLIGHIFEKKSKYDKALDYQKKALNIYENLKDNTGIAQIFENIGSIYEDLANYKEAHTYFKKALDFNQKSDNQVAMIGNLNNLGDVFRKQNELDTALYYTFQSYQLSKQFNNTYQIRSSLKDIAKTYALMQDFQKAHHYLDSSYQLYQDIFTAESALKIAQMETLFKTQEQEKEIEILAQKNRFNTILSYVFIGGILILLVLGWIIFSQQRTKIRKNKEIIEQNQKIYETQHELAQVELQNAQLKEQQLVNELDARNKELTTRALHIIQKNEVLIELKEKLEHLQEGSHIQNSSEINQVQNLISYSFSLDKDWDDFKTIFEQVHHDFFSHLQEKFSDLTAGELKLCALLKLNLSSQDMATILGISQDSLRVTRYRLRKKLQLEKGANLVSFMQGV